MLKMWQAGVTSEKLQKFNDMTVEQKVDLVKNFDKYKSLYQFFRGQIIDEATTREMFRFHKLNVEINENNGTKMTIK